MKDYHTDTDFDLVMMEQAYPASASTISTYLFTLSTRNNRMSKDFPLLWNFLDYDVDDEGCDTSRQQMHKSFTNLCSDNCTMLTFITYNRDRSHIFNEYALSAHTLQCSDTLYSEDTFTNMLGTQPSITMTKVI